MTELALRDAPFAAAIRWRVGDCCDNGPDRWIARCQPTAAPPTRTSRARIRRQPRGVASDTMRWLVACTHSSRVASHTCLEGDGRDRERSEHDAPPVVARCL